MSSPILLTNDPERVNFVFSYVIIGGVVVGASWYLGRLALGPSGASIGGCIPLNILLIFSCSCLDQEQSYPMEHNPARTWHKIVGSQSEI